MFGIPENLFVAATTAILINILILLFLYRMAYRYKYRDSMTQLYNKIYLERVVKKWIHKKKDFTVCFFDINKFKRLNDTYGHLAGDRGIIHLGHTLQKGFHKKAVVTRIGGDEFAVVFLGHSDFRYRSVFETINNQSYIYNGKSISFSVTVGICQSSLGASYDMLVEKTDENMYNNKAIHSVLV